MLIIFWQFTIKTLDELDIVSNQHLSIEMFLIRLIHLVGSNSKTDNKHTTLENFQKDSHQKTISSQNVNTDAVSQIKNVAQEKKIKPQTKIEIEATNGVSINSFDELLEISLKKKELKLKYELEKNVNLVKFENGMMEISFNDNLDKDFVKDLSTKLFEWTNQRWIISFSKIKGELSVKDRKKNKQIEIMKNSKKTDLYKSMLDHFSDAELIDVNDNKNNEI